MMCKWKQCHVLLVILMTIVCGMAISGCEKSASGKNNLKEETVKNENKKDSKENSDVGNVEDEVGEEKIDLDEDNSDEDIITLENPGTNYEGLMTWNCVYFGSYPQSEINIYKNSEEYEKLKSATEWDDQGDIVISGEKYRRIKKEDAIYLNGSQYWGYSCYSWDDEYHYFKYEPIRWRVLSVNEDDVLLLSDRIIDIRPYHQEYMDVTWETSTIRSWLNGYGSDANSVNVDFSENNFIDNAFSEKEQKAILDSEVRNEDNVDTGVSAGNDTSDKLYLLSESEMFFSDYGFSERKDAQDASKCAKVSTYAHAMGAITDKGGFWWLRSPGNMSRSAEYVYSNGVVMSVGDFVQGQYEGVRPVLKLDISATDFYTYAGTIDINGNVVQPDIN